MVIHNQVHPMKANRRNFLKSLGGAGAVLTATPALAQTDSINLSDLRGSFNANQSGLRPGAIDNQGKTLQRILDQAALERKPVFLPPGNYFVSNIILPSQTRLMGVPGATRLVYTGGGHFLMAENNAHVELTGLTLDAANRGIASYAEAALRVTNANHLVIDNCQIGGSLEKGLQIDRSAGRVERTTIRGAAGDCGLYGMENRGLTITNNTISDCANGGILVHRWSPGEDSTVVTNNRVERIGAANGGTGQWGNGINIFRADNVMVANNHIRDCAFSAIRSNSGNNVQINANQCHRSGETGIYSEFEFNGAVITNNVVDGGAVGISIANFNQDGRLAVCSGNLVRNIHNQPPYEDDPDFFGIGISAEADTTVSANVIENAKRFGMMVGWGEYMRNMTVTSNVIRQSLTGMYITVVDGTGTAVISDNIFSATPNGSIVGYRWKEIATADLLADAQAHPNLKIARNSTS